MFEIVDLERSKYRTATFLLLIKRSKHAQMYARTHTRTHARTHARTHTHTHTHTRTHARTHTRTHARTRARRINATYRFYLACSSELSDKSQNFFLSFLLMSSVQDTLDYCIFSKCQSDSHFLYIFDFFPSCDTIFLTLTD